MSVVRGGVGISVQKSKFAALTIDSLSEDDTDSEVKWTEVKPAHGQGKQKTKAKRKEAGGNDDERVLSKNAKKRARKKRQKNLSESSDGKTADSASIAIPAGLSWEQEAKMRNQSAADIEFQKDLEKAILMSQADTQDHAKMMEESRLAERVAVSESLTSAKPPSKSGGKKAVTLSLQEFHRGEAQGSQISSSVGPRSHFPNILDPLPATPTTPNESFFDRLSESVQKEIVKEERQSKKTKQLASKKDQPGPEELPRVAQLQDELEKRDTLIEKLKKHNELLKKTLKEVKQRNQSLCKILSQGEFSTKTELIEQVEELTAVKNELTEEVESLSSSLEQERSKNKILKLELAKHLGGSSKTRSGSSS